MLYSEKTAKPAQILRPNIKRLIISQCCLVLIVVFLITILNIKAGLSFFYGSVIFILPNAYFSWQSFQFIGAARASKITHAIYKGQAGKFILTALMFGFLFKFVRPDFIVIVFVSYLLNVLLNFFLTASFLNKSVNT